MDKRMDQKIISDPAEISATPSVDFFREILTSPSYHLACSILCDSTQLPIVKSIYSSKWVTLCVPIFATFDFIFSRRRIEQCLF